MEIAKFRGITAPTDEEFDRVGLPACCCCFACKRSLPHSAAYPAAQGKIFCADHIGGAGFRTVDQWEKYVALYTLHKREGGH